MLLNQKMRRLFCGVCLSLVIVAGYVAYLWVGYPAVWRQVRPGMTAQELQILCGPPDYEDGYVVFEQWYAPQVLGRWELLIGYREDTPNRAQARVGMVIIVFRPGGNDYSLRLYRAFGQGVRSPYQKPE